MVTAGYKQTEVGVIPEDWGVVSLGAYVEINSGESPSKFNFRFGGTPYYKVEQLNNSPKYLNSTPYYILSDKSVTGGSIVFPKRGASILLNKIRVASSPFYMDTNLMSLTTNENLWNEYLYYCLDYQGLHSVADTTSVPQINNKHINPFKIRYPKVPEQKAIAEALSDVDGLIASLEALIEKKRQIKTGTMQQLLTGKTRLPGFGEGKGFKETELGEIPEDWDVAALGEIGQSIIGLTYNPANISDSGTLVLRSSNVQKNRLAYQDNVFVSCEVPARTIVKKDDLLVCVRNGSKALIGKCALIDERAAGSAFGAFMTIFRSADSRFVFCQFQGRIIKKQIDDIMGATINQITNKDMGSFKIPFPTDPDERKAITSFLLDFDVEIDSLDARLAKTKALKQGMMQELLTGRTRLV